MAVFVSRLPTILGRRGASKLVGASAAVRGAPAAVRGARVGQYGLQMERRPRERMI